MELIGAMVYFPSHLAPRSLKILLLLCAAAAAAFPQITLYAPSTALSAGQSTSVEVRFPSTVTRTPMYDLTISPSFGTLTPVALNRFLFVAPPAINQTTTVTIGLVLRGASSPSASLQLSLKAPAPAPLPAPSPTTSSPSSPAAPAPVLSIAPSTVNLAAGASVALSAFLNGSPTSSVAWSVQPAIGVISASGVYTAPANMASPASVIATARLTSNTSVQASRSIQIQATPAPVLSISPPSGVVSTGGTLSFAALANNVPTSAVIWRLSPAVGTLSGTGVYTAPASLALPQTVQISATLVSNSTVTASASLQVQPPIAVSVSPNSVTLQPGQRATFQATVTGTANTAVTWSLFPNVGTISNGVYTAPASVTQPASIRVSAISQANFASTASVSVSLQPNQAPSSVALPVEVHGNPGTMVSREFSLDASRALAAQRLYLQIHDLDFENEASVQINNGPWIALTNTTYQLQNLDKIYGGIGGGFSTVRGVVALQSGWLAAGLNTIRFRFNQTDGFTNGFRILAFNLRDAVNADLLPESSFQQDDPSTWRPPLADAASIAAGKSLWYTAPLSTPLSGAIRAKCADCHAHDGRDLKYFNYSNSSIRARAVFHGLSTAQGDQIASYIRSLPQPAPGRPWNPPYQPGPGLDSRPVNQWSAGAGLEWALSRDRDALPHIFPNGFEPSRIKPSGNLSAREIPMAFQLPDWNRWLPLVHPLDAFPNFATSEWNAYYIKIRSALRFGQVSSFLSVAEQFKLWNSRRAELIDPYRPQTTPWPASAAQHQYSARLWNMVKLWEMAQEFELETMARSWFGPAADERAWVGQDAFITSPNMIQIPIGNQGLGPLNEIRNAAVYNHFVWYHLQLVLNYSNKRQDGNTPMDWAYSYQSVMTMGQMSPSMSVLLTWLAKGMQTQENGLGPEIRDKGWSYAVSNVPVMGHFGFRAAMTELSPYERSQIAAVYLREWLNKAKSFPPDRYYSGNQTSALELPNSIIRADGNFPSRVYDMIAAFKSWGVDQNLLSETAAWAQLMWPGFAWRQHFGL
jgi:hypothetical protein